MTVYTWLVVLLVAAALIFRGNKRRNTIFIVIAFVLLFAVMGLRDVNVTGNDASGSMGSYPNIYRRIGDAEWNSLFVKGGNNYNIGFKYLLKLIHEITGGDYQALITIISLYVMFSYMRFIEKYSPSSIVSVLCFLGLLYYAMLFDVLKQALAMATLLFAFDAIIEKRPVKFIIITVIASLFHFPAIVFIPAYWIGRMRLGRGYIILLAVLLLVTYAFRDRILSLMMNAYLEEDSAATMAGVKFLRNKVIIMIAFTVFAVFIKPPSAGNIVYNSLLIFLGVSIIFQAFCGYNNIFERLADYYFHLSIILIPMILEKGGKIRSRVEMQRNDQVLNYATVLICAFAIWRFLSTMNNSPSFNQFRFFWNA